VKVRVETECNRSSWIGAWRFSVCTWPAILGLLLYILAGPPALAQQKAKNVLVLFSFSDRHYFHAFDELQSRLRSALPWPIDFNVEYLEGRRLDDAEYEKGLVRDLKHTYRGVKLDLVLVESYPALQLSLRHRDVLFPGAPIVFFDVDTGRVPDQKIWSRVTGVTVRVDVRGTIELALHLHPDANTVAIITGSDSTADRFWLAQIHAELLRYQDKVRQIDLVALTTSQLFDKVAALPLQTVVLFQLAPQESIHPVIETNDILRWIGQRFPTYSIFPVDILNKGGIGGVGFDYDQELSLLAEQARRVLSGERPESIPIVESSGHQVRVDWQQLRYWHIPESALPAGALVLYREPTLWQRDRKYALAGIAVIVVQAMLIFGLLWQRARKRKAEAVVRESEERFRVMADTTPSLIWMCDREGTITYLNERRITFTGSDPGAGYDNAWTAYVHPDDLKNVEDALAWALKSKQPLSKEYRLRRHDGVYRWMFDVASPRVNGDGSFAGLIGSAIDITDQKLAKEALQTVGGRLLEAQDEERKRIARELHDDISQKLALLSMELAQAQSSANGSVEATKEHLNDIRQHCSDVAKDIQSLSHRLHYSKLDYLGLVGSLKGFCREFGKQYDVSVDFKDEHVPRQLPRNISLCLFRVTQEALHNAVKYSGTQEYTVRLSATEDELQLVVSDAGAGFDVAEVMKNQGLGLVSMQERVHLVQGRFNAESRPGEGTKIVVSVPVIAGGASTKSGGEMTASVPGAA